SAELYCFSLHDALPISPPACRIRGGPAAAVVLRNHGDDAQASAEACRPSVPDVGAVAARAGRDRHSVYQPVRGAAERSLRTGCRSEEHTSELQSRENLV